MRDSPDATPQLQNRGTRIFSLKGLALFRIAFGMILLLNLRERFRDGQIDLFYTEQGLMPISVRGLDYHWSLLDAFNTPISMRCAIVGMVFCILLYTVGLGTRFVKWGILLILLSLFHRAPLVDDGSDWVMRLWAIWTAFLPLGRVWSLDARLLKGRRWTFEPDAPLASIFLTINLSLSYFLNVAQKSAESWSTGDAVFLALHMPLYASPFGVWLRSSFICSGLSGFSVLALLVESLLAASVLFALRFPLAKKVTFIGMFFLHGSFLLTMQLGSFPWIYLALALIFLPFKDDDTTSISSKSWGTRIRLNILPVAFACLAVSSLLRLNPIIPDALKQSGKAYTPTIAYSISRFLAVTQQWYMFSDVSEAMTVLSLRIQKRGELALDAARGRESSPEKDIREPTRLSKYWTSYILRMALPDYTPYRVPLAEYYFERGYDDISLLFTHAQAPQYCNGDYSKLATKVLFAESRPEIHVFTQSNILPVAFRPAYVILQDMSQFGHTWIRSTQIHGRFSSPGQQVSLEFLAPEGCNARVLLDITTAPDYGLIGVAINGAPQAEFNTHNALGVFAREVEIGRAQLVAGRNRVVVTSLETQATKRDKFGLIAIKWRCDAP